MAIPSSLYGIVSHSMKYIFVWSQWSLPHAWDLRKYALAPLFLVGATSFIGLVLAGSKNCIPEILRRLYSLRSIKSSWKNLRCCVCGMSVLWHLNIRNILSPQKRSCHQHIVSKSFSPTFLCFRWVWWVFFRGFGVVCCWKIYRCQSCDLMRFGVTWNPILYWSFLFNIYIVLHIYNISSHRYL